MTKNETIYNALGIIEGAVCVSQKNTRDVLMKAIQMIKNAVEEDAEPEVEAKTETGYNCDHQWEFKQAWEYAPDENGKPNCCAKYKCICCGETEFREY